MSGSIRRKIEQDAGLTVIEMLVGFSIFAILTTLAFTTVMSGSSNLKAVRQTNDLNEEARLVLNRMSRELRQASKIASAENPDITNADGSPRICGSSSPPCFDPDAPVSVTFEVDFNGVNGIEPLAGDPERLTYRYDRPNRRLLLQTASESTPILAGNVHAFKISYRSSNYKCDRNSNGEVTWQELGTAPSPPCPPLAGSSGPSATLDTELDYIDQLIIDLTVLTPPREQQYRTKVDLRNNLRNRE